MDTVYPGEPASVALTECDRLDNCLRPGQTIEKFVIQVLSRPCSKYSALEIHRVFQYYIQEVDGMRDMQAFDDFKNVVETGCEIRFRLEGLQFLGKRVVVRQVMYHS